MKSSRTSLLLLNCLFLSLPEYRKWLESAIEESSLHHIVTLNAEMILEAAHNEAFKNAVLRAELKIPDGSSMLWAREYLEQRRGGGILLSLFSFLFSKEQTLTGVDTVYIICDTLEKINGAIYLLGGEKQDAIKTAKILHKKYPGLVITVLSDTEALVSLKATSYKLKATAGSALLVAYGSPKQTLWIEQRRDELEKAGIRIAIGIGGAFAMISGRLPRAPKIFRALHLEWLWRLLLEPKRIKRIWNAVIVFPRFIAGYPH